MNAVRGWYTRLTSFIFIFSSLIESLQVIVSSILLRPHATETDATMLSSTSTIRVQVEELRMDILRWLRKRWVGVRQEGGFNALEGWAVKEISGGVYSRFYYHYCC
jgi:hypothetical protein